MQARGIVEEEGYDVLINRGFWGTFVGEPVCILLLFVLVKN